MVTSGATANTTKKNNRASRESGWCVHIHTGKKHVKRGDSDQTLHVEYAQREKEYGILYMLCLSCEYIHLE